MKVFFFFFFFFFFNCHYVAINFTEQLGVGYVSNEQLGVRLHCKFQCLVANDNLCRVLTSSVLYFSQF